MKVVITVLQERILVFCAIWTAFMQNLSFGHTDTLKISDQKRQLSPCDIKRGWASLTIILFADGEFGANFNTPIFVQFQESLKA